MEPLDITKVTAVNSTQVSIPNPPTLYTKEEILERVANYDQRIADLQAQSQPWRDLLASDVVVALKTEAEVLSVNPAIGKLTLG